jgi:hypothetical protein
VRSVWVCLALAAWPAGAQSAPAEELRGLVRQVLRNLRDADADLADFAYDRFNIRRQFDGDGKLATERTVLARRAFIGDFGYIQQVERDGQPVPGEQLRRELETFHRQAAEWNAVSPETRQAMRAEMQGRRVEQNAWLRELPDAADYRRAGEELVDGRAALVLEFSPRPGYKAKNLRARVFEKVRGRMWIDKADTQLVRVEAEVFDTVNIGWGVVGRIHKGTRYQAERRKLGDAWLPVSQTVRFAARVFLLKTFMQEEITRYSAFRHKSVAASAE